MNLSARERMIVTNLYHSSVPLTTEELASKINVSVRTIKSDISQINSKVDSESFKVVTKPRVGVWLEVKEGSQVLQEIVALTQSNFFPNTPEERHFTIIQTLVRENKRYLTFEKLASDLFVSKSTITKDMNKVEEFLVAHRFDLEKNVVNGTRINLNERDVRKLTILAAKRLLFDENSLHYDKLKLIFPCVNVDALKQALITAADKSELRLTDLSFQDLLIYLVVSTERINQKFFLGSSSCSRWTMDDFEWIVASDILDEAKDVVNDRRIEEVAALANQFIGIKLQSNLLGDDQGSKKAKDVNPHLYENLINILTDLSERLDINLIDDEELLDSLFAHLNVSLKRMLNNISVENPLLEGIKQNYKIPYEMAIQVAGELGELYNCTISEDEIGYIALYFGVYKEKSRRDQREKTAIIVCSTGVGSAQLLLVKMESHFPQVKILKAVSSIEAERLLENELNPDFILATVPFTSKKHKVIHISPFLTEKDIQLVRLSLRVKAENQRAFNSRKLVSNYYKHCLSFFKAAYDSQDEILRLMSQNLIKRDYVTAEFYESLRERENFSSTNLGNLVAIPHAYDGHVKKPAISVMTLKKPVMWGESRVQIIFLIALDSSISHEFKEIYEGLIRLIADQKAIKNLINCNDYDEFMKIFEGEV